ncbi:MAG: archease [bacterium]
MAGKCFSYGERAVGTFTFLDHTGDVGFAVRGRSLEELFQNAAKALFSVITDRRRIRRRIKESINISAPELESLLVQWLGELLFLFDARGLLFSDFRFETLENHLLHAMAWGEPYEQGRHVIKTGIKAVTYHQIKVEKRRGLWRARIILDI